MKSSSPSSFQNCFSAALMTVLALVAQSGRANLTGPYTADANTLHLWHFNEVAVPCVDAGNSPTNLVGLANGATLNNAAFTGFGTALSTVDQGQALFGTTNSDAVLTIAGNAVNAPIQLAGAVTPAFTMEAIVRIDFDPTINLGSVGNGGNGRNAQCMILTGEGNANANRIFQFRVDPIGTAAPLNLAAPMLEFINLRQAVGVQNLLMEIPTTGPDAIVSNGWYHVAVTYSGTPNTASNVLFYWTKMDSSRLFANFIGGLNMANNMSSNVTVFTVGNSGRNPSGNPVNPVIANFLGLIDEVRISSVARPAGQMAFFAPIVFVTSGPDPTNQVVALGQPATFSVTAGGLSPTYQWRHAGTNLPGATASTLTIPAATALDAGNYTVVITNISSALTSSVATLTVRTPVNLTWAGSGFASSLWNTTDVNWDSTGDTVADLAYIPGDNVRFDDNGLLGGNSVVDYSDTLTPSAVVVSNTVGDYYLLSNADTGLIGGNARLVKQGGSTLIVNTDNSNTGGTLIVGGLIQVGSGAARGALGSGPITNNTGLVFNRTGNLAVPGKISGPAGLTNTASGNIILSGPNTYSGDTAASAGAITLANAQALGSSTNVVLTTTVGGPGLSGTRLALDGGISAGAGVTVTMPSSLAPDYRCNLFSVNGSNIWNGAVVLEGDGVIGFGAEGASLIVAGPVTGPNFNGGKLIMRGNGLGSLSGSINLPNGHCSKTEGGTWVLAGAGNVWTNTDIAGGTLRLGVNNAIPVTATVNMTGGNLDLAGFNQTIAVLNGTSGPIGNSSTNSDSLLTINSNTDYTGVIQDSVAGGTRKVAVAITGGPVTLGGVSTYTGNTTVNSGTLALAGNGNIGGSAVIALATGTTWDLSAKTGAGVALGATQTLKGTGTVIGSVTNNGTIVPGASIGTLTFNNNLVLGSSGTLAIEVNKTANTKDVIVVAGNLIYGGTLNVTNLAGTLNIGDSFTICTAGLPTGNFATVTGAAGSGQAWSFNPTSGVVSVVAGVNTTPTNITALVTGSGTQYDLSWPASHTGWRLQAQTNSLSVGIATNWVNVTGSTTTNHVVIPINPANGSVFFRLIYP